MFKKQLAPYNSRLKTIEIDPTYYLSYIHSMRSHEINPLMTHCPICHALYAKKQIKLLEEGQFVRLFHSTCESCGHGMFAYVTQGLNGMSSLGLVTDVSGTDVEQYIQASPVSADECIQARKLLYEQSRDLCKRLLDISGKLA